MPRILGTNISHNDIFRLVVLRIVKLEAETGALLNKGFPQLDSLLAYTAGKDYCVNLATKFDIIGTDKVEDTVDEEVIHKFARRVVRSRNLAKIGRARHGFEATLLVQDFLSLSQGQPVDQFDSRGA